MPLDQQQTKLCFNTIIEQLGKEHHWQWEERRRAWLSEFSRDKIDSTLAVLNEHFTDQWHIKNIKSVPKSLKSQLNELTKLTKEQKLFTTPASEQQPTLLAIWWPWGHGATVSLRLMTLSESYKKPVQIATKDNFFMVVKKLFS